MSRARLTAAALCTVAGLGLLFAAVGVAEAGGGNADRTPTPLSAGPSIVGLPSVGSCDAQCAPSTTIGSEVVRRTTTTTSAPSHAALVTTGTTETTAAARPRLAPTSSAGSVSHGAAVTTPLKHVLAGYWEDFVNHATPLRLASVPSGYNLVDVAFAAADASHDGGVTFTLSPALASAVGGYTTAQFAADVATLHAQGQRVLISVNSAGGAVSVNSPSTAEHFAESVSGLMSIYGFDGADIDFENGLNVAYTAQALQNLAALRPGVLITLAPQTSDMETAGGAYFQLALSIRSILTMSFTQYYNSGTMLGCDGAVYTPGTEDFMTALACTQLRGGLKPSQVGLGLPASASAAKHGYVAPSVLDSALGCLAVGTGCGSFVLPTTWPAIGGAMTWSINWDASNGYAFLHGVGPYLASLP